MSRLVLLGLMILASLAAATLGLPGDDAALSGKEYAQDFDTLWEGMRDGYAYFDKRATDWTQVKAVYRPRAAAAASRDEFVAVLEDVLGELYDHHAHLNTNTAASPHLVPSGTDLWAEWREGRAIITQVRPGSTSAKAGLTAGTEVVSIEGAAAAEAVKARVGKCLRQADPEARDWALRVVLAGRHDHPRRLGVRLAGAISEVTLEAVRASDPGGRLLEHRRVGPGGAFGYLRVINSLGDRGLVREFDAALAALRDSRGLVLDLRDTPSGGNTTMARALMGRLISREAPYQKHSLPAEEREFGVRRSWLELASPRGEFAYGAPVVVLVDRWTGSMGEGMTVGLDGLGRAKAVGTRMAGLLGATHTVTLPNSRIDVNFPAEKLFHINGTPREEFAPAVLVDLQSVEKLRAEDAILEAGLTELRRITQPPGEK